MEQDGLKTNIAKHTTMLRGQGDLRTVADLILTEAAPLVSAQYGAFYVVENREGDEPVLRMTAGYAISASDTAGEALPWGGGLGGPGARGARRGPRPPVPAGALGRPPGFGGAAPKRLA